MKEKPKTLIYTGNLQKLDHRVNKTMVLLVGKQPKK